MKQILLGLILILCWQETSFSKSKKSDPPPPSSQPSQVPSDIDHRWSDLNSPLDFSGLISLFSPGVGLEGLVGYRINNDLVPRLDDSLSIEGGLGFVTVSDRIAGQEVSYSLIDIPIMARWDARLINTKFTVGGEAGFHVISGSSITVNGTTYGTRGGNVYLLVGGNLFYKITDKVSARLGLHLGGFTSLAMGIIYFF